MCDSATPPNHTSDSWCPDFCPMTGRPFFMWIENSSNNQMVPTYGGPYDSYTIPFKNEDGTYLCERYDHDRGEWVEGFKDVGLQVVDDQLYTLNTDPNDYAAECIQSLRFPTMLRKMWNGSEVQEWLTQQADQLRMRPSVKGNKHG